MLKKSSRVAPLLGAAAALLLSGCYYGHLAVGQTRLLLAREPIAKLLADPDTEPRLRAQLGLVEQARAFAAELGLAVDGQYTSYVAWPGDRVVTTVVATRPGEVEPAGFSFPIVGRVPYKGFFSEEAAVAFADSLRDEGMDVCVVAVPAYSTLGWLDDPLTAPMLHRPDVELVETLLHELVHATVFVASQPEFNEGAANFVGQEASLRFLERHRPEALDEAKQRIEDDRAVARALLGFREQVAALYAEGLDPEQQHARRAALEDAARRALSALPLRTIDAQRLAQQARLNDACQALRGTYALDTPRHARVLESLDGDLGRFVARLRESADAEDPRARFFAEPIAATPSAG